RVRAAGHAQSVWLTRDPRSGDAETPDAGTASNVRRLVGAGVPATDIVIVPGEARRTRAELDLIGIEARRRGVACVIVVTSAAHGARVKATWLRHGGAAPRLVVRHAPNAAYTGWKVASREAVG